MRAESVVGCNDEIAFDTSRLHGALRKRLATAGFVSSAGVAT